MDAGPQLGIARVWIAAPAVPLPWRRGIAITLWALLALAALLLVTRLAAGALEAGLSPAGLIAAGLVLLAASAVIRLIWPTCDSTGIEPHLVQWAPSVLVALAALALSIPSGSLGGAAVLWLLILGGETCSIRAFRARWKSPTPRAPRTVAPPTVVPVTPVAEAAAPSESILDSDPGELPALADGVVQQFTRVHTPAGEDVIQGLMRAEFVAGERTAMLHIAFCPPFATMPQIHVEQLGGPPARIKPGPIQPFGARIEVRLNHPTPTAASVLIEFVAEMSL